MRCDTFFMVHFVGRDLSARRLEFLFAVPSIKMAGALARRRHQVIARLMHCANCFFSSENEVRHSLSHFSALTTRKLLAVSRTHCIALIEYF